jgi:hypothetical protein
MIIYVIIALIVITVLIFAVKLVLNLLEKKRAFANLELATKEFNNSTKMVEELKKTVEKTEKTTIKEIEVATVNASTAKKLANESKIAYDKKMAELEEAKKNKDNFSIAGITQKSITGSAMLAEYTQMVTTEKQAAITNTILQTLKSESSKVLIGLNGQLGDANKSKAEWELKLKQAKEAVKKYQT